MKKLFINVLLLVVLSVISCVSVQYTRTGEKYPPLPEDAVVAFFSETGPKQIYKKLGTVRVKGGGLDEKIAEAKKYARMLGGDGLVAVKRKTIGEESRGEGNGKTGNDDVVEFEVVKFVTGYSRKARYSDKKKTIEENAGDGEKRSAINTPTSLNQKDYINLPRVRYKDLITGKGIRKGGLYRGTLYPVGFFKVPAALKGYAARGKKLLMMKTGSGRNSVLLMVPEDMEKDIRYMIKTKQVLDFVYTPVDIYRARRKVYPLLEFIDEIK